jgi:hypothetical protein
MVALGGFFYHGVIWYPLGGFFYHSGIWYPWVDCPSMVEYGIPKCQCDIFGIPQLLILYVEVTMVAIWATLLAIQYMRRLMVNIWYSRLDSESPQQQKRSTLWQQASHGGSMVPGWQYGILR